MPLPASSFEPAGSGTSAPASFTVTPIPLPVELTAFTATLLPPATVRLTWATANEQNSAHFEVERSPDGTGFTRIGTRAAAGTSAAGQAYQLLDAHLPPEAPLLYYRLRQVDVDGTFSYSPVRSVSWGGKPVAGLTLVPNPTRNTTLGGAAAGATVEVYNALGCRVLTAVADAAGTAQLVLPVGLASGVYVVRSGPLAVRWSVE